MNSCPLNLPRLSLVILICLMLLTGCNPAPTPAPTQPPPTDTATATITAQPSATTSPTPLPTDTPSPTATETAVPTLTPSATLSPTALPTPASAGATPAPLVLAAGQIAFVSEQGEGSEIYLINSDGTRLQPLTGNGYVNRDPVWSPDGAYLAFTSQARGAQGNIQTSGIYRLNADGSGALRLTPPDLVASGPAWSPDGRWLAFSGYPISLTGALSPMQIYVLDTASLALRPVTQAAEGNAGCYQPQWLADSTRLVVYCHALMQGFLMLLDTRAGQLTEILNWQMALPFALSADNAHAAFVEGRAVALQKLVGAVSWRGVRFARPDQPNDTLPVHGFGWSPVRGNQLAVLAGTQVYLVQVTADSWTSQVLSDGLAWSNSFTPRTISWSPDGSNLVFPATVDGHDALFITGATGRTELRRLTQNTANESQPAWRP